MFVTYAVVTVLTVLANLAIAAADLRPAEFVLANSREVAVSPSWLPGLAVLKAAGALGLVCGIVGVAADVSLGTYVGIAAAVGLTAFFTVALGTHVRLRVFHNIYFPATYFLLAVASLVLLVTVRR